MLFKKEKHNLQCGKVKFSVRSLQCQNYTGKSCGRSEESVLTGFLGT